MGNSRTAFLGVDFNIVSSIFDKQIRYFFTTTLKQRVPLMLSEEAIEEVLTDDSDRETACVLGSASALLFKTAWVRVTKYCIRTDNKDVVFGIELAHFI